MHADVLLVTVTKVESESVLRVFGKTTHKKPLSAPIGDKVYFDLGVVNGARVFLAQSAMGSGGLGAAQQTVEKGIDALSPAAVVMVGIAFGIDAERQRIGDILVSKQLVLYELQRISTDQEGRLRLDPRGARPDASAWLFNRFQHADVLWQGSKAKVIFGPILSGEKLIHNEDFREQLRNLEPGALGGEMEGAGLYAACQDRKVDWILVKAISDWADGQHDPRRHQHQQLAARNAARFVLRVLQQVPLKRATASIQPEGPIAPSDLIARPSIRSSLPHQLCFFGREKELKVIADALAVDSRGWGVLIDGPGGIGKTALAIRAANLAPVESYPFKIFLSAKTRELSPSGEQPLEDFMLPSFLELLSELATELGEREIACAPPNERANAVRHTLTRKQALLVIDNVETFGDSEGARLFQFLSRLPAGCKAIVTSRRRASVDAKVIRLDRLALKGALALMEELAKSNLSLNRASAQERTKLHEITDGNPLLIKWVVGQLGRPGSRCRTISEACESMKSGTSGNDPIEFVFGDLLDTFTKSESAVLAALTHFTQPAKVEWIADLSTLERSATQTALEDLADRALLVGDDAAQSFLLPTVASTFLRRKSPESVAQTGDRLSERVLALAMENGYDNHECFPRLEAEWPTVAAALPLFLQGDNRALQSLADALIDFLHFTGRWEDWLWLSRQAEEKAIDEGDFHRAGWRALQTGWVHHLYRQPAEVQSCADRCEAHWRQSRPGADERAAVIQLRGLGHRIAKDFPAAIAHFKKALALDQVRAPRSQEVVVDLNHLAETERLSGNYRAAVRHYREAMRISESIGFGEGTTDGKRYLAGLELDRADCPAAEQLAREALSLAEGMGSREAIGHASWILAKAVARQGRPQEGLTYAERAVDLFTKLRMPGNLEEAQAALKECRVDARCSRRACAP